MSHLTYLEAIVMGAIQGITELFPISSLGHSVIIPALVGGQWAKDLDVSAPESPYLAFIVGLHVATALALLAFFWRDWLRIIGGLVTSIRYRRVRTGSERLAWLIILATIPVGIAGLLLEHLFRTVLGQPLPAAAFLVANGLVMLVGELIRRRAQQRANTAPQYARTLTPDAEELAAASFRRAALEADRDPDEALGRMPVWKGLLIGTSQILALLPGISRSGITMVSGMAAGLTHREAARFAFLLATPVILAAGALKLPDLLGPLGAGIHGEILAGSAAAFLAVAFLDRYFTTRTLIPFGIYSLIAGTGAIIWLTVR